MPQSNIPLGDTENVFFGTQEVDTLIIDGTTVWQKVIALPQDIDGDGIANASDNTPAIRLRGIRQSGGGINWYVYVIFTNTSLTHAKIHVSGGAQFSGNLQDTETLSDQGSYKTAVFSSSSMSSAVNGYTSYAYFRFPVSSDNGSSYTNSQNIESIQVAIPTVGSSAGDEASTYKHLYQSL